MDFPCLTGRKPRTRSGDLRSTTIESKVTLASICKATSSVGALPISALQAAWAVILSTYLGAQDNVVFATAIGSPPSRDSNDAFYIIPTQVRVYAFDGWNPLTNGEILRQLAESTDLAVQSNKQASDVSKTREQLSRRGTLIALHSKDDSDEKSDKPIAREDVAFSVSVSPSTTGLLRLKATYTDMVLDDPSACLVLAQLNDVLAHIINNLTKPLQTASIAIRSSLLSISNHDLPEVNGYHTKPPRLQSQFEETARFSPDRPALEFWHDIHPANCTTWTYDELNARADAFTNWLIHSFGHLSDKVIPICMDRRPELYVVILGILKAGGAWCPIDASFPARRRYGLIARTGSQVLIVADRKVAEDNEGIPRGVVAVDITAVDTTTADETDLSEIRVGSLAYLIWTSGTTGEPKGVPIHHKAAITSMRALQRSIPTDVSGGIVRCMQFSHFTFDVFIQDLFYTWGVGGTIISSTRGLMLGSFSDLANKTNATHAHLTPAFAASVPRDRCRTLEVITMIGEKLSQVVADDWGQDMRAYNTYGPAETAVVSTYRQFGGVDDEMQSENVGFPLPSVSAFVMRDGFPLMRHGVGELALGGPQLSKGYWDDPEKTACRFVWNEQYSRHLYMTGDMVRQLHDGSLEFVGREDDLIKIQGIRVELSEISFGLRVCHPLVELVETQYLDRKDRPSKVIVAFLAAPKLRTAINGLVAIEKAAPIARAALLEAQKSLPEYMIPRVFLVVNSIPRTLSNKTDKKVLQEIYSSSDLGTWERALATDDGEPTEGADWSPQESSILATIGELSGTSRGSMSRHSNLRSIGIDSITATRLAPMLNARGISISIADILECHDLTDMLKISAKIYSTTQRYDLEAFQQDWCSNVSKNITTGDFIVAPALPLQESLLSESMQNVKAYWSNVFLSLGAHIDLPRLHEAWSHVVGNTEALRTGFVPTAAIVDNDDNTTNTFLQLIYNEARLEWAHVLSSEAQLKDLAPRLANEIAERCQKAAFKNPPIAITVIEQPQGCTMMISIHHCIRDEPSFNFILNDVWKRYNEQALNQRHQLREALQLLLPTKDRIEQDEDFWSKTLSNYVETDDSNTFPKLSGSGENRPEGFITHVHTVSKRYKELQNAAFELGATSVASILRVAWGCILLMYLETESTVFAETWSDRIDDPVLADVVGPLTTVLPVPFRATGSAREVLAEQSRTQQDSRAHRSIHGRSIRKLLKRPEHQSLYPALFNFLPAADENTGEDWTYSWSKQDNIIALTVEHPLALNFTPSVNGEVELELIADQNVISTAHLTILAKQVDAFVEAMLRAPDMPLMQLTSHLPEALLSKTSVTFSNEVKAASGQDPLTWVDHYAKAQPHWPAAMFFGSIEEFESESWSFAELQSAYNRVANFIRHYGYQRKMIAVCLDRRLEAYAVVLGILASGNTYLPIDEDLPEERKSFLLQDSQAVMLFTTTNLASTFVDMESRMICVDEDTYMDRAPNGHSVDTRTSPQADDNAYLLYTSGSTGVPKGVLVGRGNLCSFIEGLSEYIYPIIPGMKELPGKGRYLGLASRAFDVHLAEMFLAWRRGLAAVTAPRTLLLDNLEQALRTLKITHASFVPSLIDQAGLDPANLPDLHYLGVGGEKMSKRVVDAWAASENATLVNAYGPTELSIGCAAAEVKSESNLRNIGRPYGNSVAHVLVPGSMQYTLRGVAGELCFTGDLVANGYHNRSDAKGFVDDFHGQRMYRTGDVVRLMADDTLEYLRREDDQIKVRGQRLELGEISEAIRTSVTTALGFNKVDVATIVAQHPKLPKPQLVNFVVAQSSSTDSPPEMLRTTQDREMAGNIQDRCSKVLPAFMVPDVIIPLAKLPLAPASGKADQKRLKSLFADAPLEDIIHHPGQSDSSRRELTDDERTIRSVVASTLAIDGAEISSNTNIFRFGLESLSAINLAIKLQKLGYECTVSTVLKNSTLERLALLPRKEPDKIAQTSSHIAALRARFLEAHPDVSSHTAKPCLPLQETLVASSLNDQGRAVYVNDVILKLSNEIDLSLLHKAWTMVVAEHDILRTCFQEFQRRFIQVVYKPSNHKALSWDDITTSDPQASIQDIRHKPPPTIISEMGERPPLRLTLFRTPSNDQSPLLLFQIHHALYDAESFAMILEDLDKRYRSAPVSKHTSFDSLIEHVCSQDQAASKDFWRHYLAGYEPTSTMDHTEADKALTSCRAFTNLLTELEDFSASISGTLTSTIQAVFGIVLAQTLKTHDVVYGAVLSGRTVPIERPNTIVAPCITTIPQRVNLGTEVSTITDVMKVAQQGFVESLTYQHTALRFIHRWVEADKPLFDCLVTYVQKKSHFHSDLWTELEGSMANDFPLAVEFEADRKSNQMRVQCVFKPAFGGIDRAAGLLENIDLLLGALVRRENVTTEDLGISKATKPNTKQQIWDESNWSPMESKIQELAAEICGISSKDISKGSSFFSLGIDSITAIRFAQRLRQAEIECSSADVMRYACIGALAQHVDARPTHTNGIEAQGVDLEDIIPEIPVLSPDDIVTDVYQCTPLQSSMLTQTLGSDGKLYAHHHAIRLSDAIDLPRLERGWASLTARTQILRTTFHFSRDQNIWLAAVHQDCVKTWTKSDSMSEIIESFAFHDEASFEHPPFKTTILENSNETLFVVSMHHSLYDGVSINLLFQDLARLCDGVDLDPRSPFSDAAKAIAKTTRNAEHFWIQRLQGFEGSDVSSKATRTDFSNIEHTLRMSVESALGNCKELGVTVQTVALLAYAKNLACLSARRDVVFGHVVGGRSLTVQGADDIVGPLFNTVPSRITLDKTYITNRSMAKEIQHSSGESQAHQHASLAKIQQAWRRKSQATDAQLLDSVFVFQNNRNSTSSLGRLGTPAGIGGTVDPTEYSLNVEFEQGRSEFVLRANATMEGQQLQDWLVAFDETFQDIVKHPSRSVLAFPPLLQSLPLSVKNDTRSKSSESEDSLDPGPDMDVIREALSKVSQIPSENISTGVSIFSLGLDSIAAIQVAATCRKQGYALSVADVLQGRSLGGICRRLRDRSRETPNGHVEEPQTLINKESRSIALAFSNLQNEDVEDVLPCLAGQVYHLASWLKSGRTTSEAVFTYQCSNHLDVDCLRLAWRRLRDHHSILRTVLVAVSPTEALQVVLKPLALNDSSFSSIDTQEPTRQQLQQHFNLFTPPCILQLVRSNTQSHILLKLHHATYDAWTIPTIISDLAALYQNAHLHSPASFSSFIKHTLQSLHTEAEQSYWRKSLSKCQQTLLLSPPTKSPIPTSTTTPPTTTPPTFMTFPSAIPSLHSLEKTCNAFSISIHTLLLTAFARTLARYTSTTHPTFGLYQAGRSASFSDIEKLCAPCLNVTPVCLQDALNISITEGAQRLQEDLAERVPYEQSYLEKVLEYVAMGGKPIFNAFINILSSPASRSSEEEERENGLFTQCEIPEDEVIEIHPAAATTDQTAIDRLSTSYLADQNLYLDVVRKDGDDCVDFAVKCDSALLDEDGVRDFMGEIVREVRGFAEGHVTETAV
ncbi:MAG: hypothetical protein Q9166_007713 [cf. Caloplaca sp. 2 TL-2023]